MIDKLTKAQEEKLAEYRDKWLKIGLSTKQIDLKKAIEIKNGLYSKILKQKDVPVIVMDSPYTTWLATLYLGALFYGDKAKSQVRSQVWRQVWSQVGSQVGSQVESQVGSQVWSQVESQVESQVRSQVRSQVESQVGSQVWSQVASFVWPYICGHFESGYFSYYDFMLNCLGVNTGVDELFNEYAKTTEAGLIYPCDEFCVMSNRPTNINMKDGRLHCDGGPAIEYQDGFKVWSLNGVRVPQYLAETPEGKLDIEFFKKEKNADVKAEFIRKFGVERMQSLGNKICDAKGHPNEWFRKSEYELVNMGNIFGIDYAPFLKMKNLTTETIHFEGVHPDCRTIEDALKFRTKNRIINLEGVK